MRRNQPIGQLLVRAKLIEPAQLREALDTQLRTGLRLASQCLKSKLAEEADLVAQLSTQAGVPGVRLDTVVIDLRCLTVISREDAESRTLLPLRDDGERMFVAVADANEDIEHLEVISGRMVLPCVALEGSLRKAIANAFDARRAGKSFYVAEQAPDADSPRMDVLYATEIVAVPGADAAAPAGPARPQDIPDEATMTHQIEIDALGGEIANDLVVGSDLFPAVSDEELAKSSDPPAHLLLADADPETVELVGRVAGARGFELTTTHRGLEVVRHLRQRFPDVILLAAELPDLHGFELARRLKAHRRYRHVPIIMLSESRRDWRVIRDLQDNFDVLALLEKPLRLNEFTAAISKALRPKTQRGAMSPDAQRQFTTAGIHYKKGDLAAAIEAIREGIRLDPLSAKLHFQLGVLCLKKRTAAFDAIDAFEQAVRLEPTFFEALRAAALLFQSKGFVHRAMGLWEQAAECSPDAGTAKRIRDLVESLR